MSTGDVDFSSQEVKDMEELIVSLSKEPTDEARRSRVASIFEERLAGPNGDPERFSNLFNQVLMIVGDRVKMTAQRQAIEMEAAQKDEESENDSKANQEEESPESSSGLNVKTAEQKQLWALVDMMVQSKTIVKTKNGELGSQGTFA